MFGTLCRPNLTEPSYEFYSYATGVCGQYLNAAHALHDPGIDPLQSKNRHAGRRALHACTQSPLKPWIPKPKALAPEATNPQPANPEQDQRRCRRRASGTMAAPARATSDSQDADAFFELLLRLRDLLVARRPVDGAVSAFVTRAVTSKKALLCLPPPLKQAC